MMMFSWLIVLLLAIFVWRNSSRTKQLQQRLDELEFVVKRLREQVVGPAISETNQQPELQRQEQPEEPNQNSSATDDIDSPSSSLSQPNMISQPSATESFERVAARPNPLAQSIQDNWMIWLGGLCVALAGIFLAKYSIEQGLFGPSARIALGVTTGLVLHAVAEWLRRKTGESHASFAALAGGGSITLFAILLAALHLYELISPALTFVLLAVVALATMLLAYWHGPALAAIGLLGAYAVPIFISDGSGAIRFAMGYALMITAAGLLLLPYVYRPWLWRGILVGALAWWIISLGYPGIELEQSWYLAVLAYFIVALPNLDFFLNKTFTLPNDKARTLLFDLSANADDVEGAREEESLNVERESSLRIALYLMVLAQAFITASQLALPVAAYAYTPLLLVLLFAARNRESLTVLPWALVLAQITAITLSQLQLGRGSLLIQPLFGQASIELVKYTLLTSIIAVIIGWAIFKSSRFKGIWSAFITMVPVFLLALSFFLTDGLLSKWQWAGLATLASAVYLFIAGVLRSKNSSSQLLVWLTFGGHFAASLAAVILTQDGHLTLAIALQLVSTAWIIQHFKLPALGWLLKIVVAVVVVRLTLNPWLVSYVSDGNWTLITYGGSTLCCVVAMVLLRAYPNLNKWAEGAALHLFVLLLWSQLRYHLHGGNIFSESAGLLEASLSMILFGAISIVYYRRSLVSEQLRRLYILFSYGLMAMTLYCYLVILFATISESAWLWANIGETPMWNRMLLSFGMPVLLGVLTWRFHAALFRRSALIFTAGAAFIFINLQIKHLWQGNIRLYDSMPSGELYSYSVVWLVIAVAAILGASLLSKSKRLDTGLCQLCYRTGLVLLGLVIAKLFLVDMAGLDGLLRVASFMGLGLTLLGVSYLHQRIQASFDKKEGQT